MKRAVAWLMGEEGSKLGGPTKKAESVSTPAKSTVKKGKKGVEDENEDEEADSNRRKVVADSDDEGSDEEEGDVNEAGWESGSVSGGDDVGPLTKQVADSDSEDDEDSIPVRPLKKSKTKEAKPKPTKQTQPSKKLTSSTFLPSLSTGFTRGGSDDSDPDDDFAEGLEDIIGKGKTGERKNRRGQQARRLYVYFSNLGRQLISGSGRGNTARTPNMSKKLVNKLQRVISPTHMVKELAPPPPQRLSPRDDQPLELDHLPQ